MNDMHLEQPESLKKEIAELTDVVRNLATEQELRNAALNLAIHVYTKPDSQIPPSEILSYAESFLAFLSSDGKAD